MQFNFFQRRRSCIAVIAFVLLATSVMTSRAQQASVKDKSAVDPEDSYAKRVPGIVYVQYREGYGPQIVRKVSPGGRVDPVQKIFQQIGVTSIEPFDGTAWKDSICRSLGIDRMYIVNYTANENPILIVNKLLLTGHIQSASPEYLFKPQWVPNDYSSADQRYMVNIQAEQAWDITRGDSNVIIADVDEGVNYNHEDLKGNIKYNAGEFVGGKPDPNNTKDLDGDGFVNDWRGWDAAGNTTGGTPTPDNDPYPSINPLANEPQHGTETTGCFGAVADNKIGIAGVAPNCKILPVKIANDYGQLIAGYQGVHYAARYGAKPGIHLVINCSWGGRLDPSALPFFQTFSSEVTARGEVMVASAGNYSLNNDITPFYPANLQGVLSVGATGGAAGPNGDGVSDKPSSFTHYGHSVSVFAPGVRIYTTDLGPANNEYTDPQGGVDGTSFSGPIAAGVVGLVMSKFPTLSPDAVKKRVIETCDPVKNADPYLYHGRVNAYAALLAPTHPSLAISGFSPTILDKIGDLKTLRGTFENFDADGSNLYGKLQIGNGYSWESFDPLSEASWPQAFIGSLPGGSSQDQPFDKHIFRTGQFSEGFATLNIAVYDGSNYRDTLHIQIPLTKQPGMTHEIVAPHATCAKQVDATTGWAGFGYYFRAHNPETGQDTLFYVSGYSRRDASGWSDPAGFTNGGVVPIVTLDAIDDQNAWFGGHDPISGNNYVLYTNDGGGSFQQTSVPVIVHSIHFKDANHGVLIGESGGTWQTMTSGDGGNSWTQGSLGTAGEITFNNGACWNGNDYAWFGTNKSNVFRTTDGGATWRKVSAVSSKAEYANVMAIGIAPDNKFGCAAVRGYGPSTDSAALFTTGSGGLNWSIYTKTPANFIPYSITFIPGTDTAIITSNQGVFTLASITDSLHFLGYPSSWDARNSVISAGGTSAQYTISASSENSGIADYTVGAANAVRGQQPSAELSLASAPNPFSNSTTLYFSTPKEEHVRIAIVDVLGRTVLNVLDGTLPAGPHAVAVKASDLAPGMYHCSIETESGERQETKLVVVR